MVINDKAAEIYQSRTKSLDNRNGHSRSRKNSKEPKVRKITAFEKYEEMRYTGFELDTKIKELATNFEAVETPPGSATVSIPIELFLKMKQGTQTIS